MTAVIGPVEENLDVRPVNETDAGGGPGPGRAADLPANRGTAQPREHQGAHGEPVLGSGRVVVRTPCRHFLIMYSPRVRADGAQAPRDGAHGGKGAGVNGSRGAASGADLAVLVAELGALVRKFEDLGIRLYSADEVEGREFAAYAVGWRDALAALPPQIRRSDLTLLEGGLVIPFPRTSFEGVPPGVGGTAPPPADTGPTAPPRTDSDSGPDSDADVDADVDADSNSVPDLDTGPRFVEKNARSKSPTVPRIEREQSRRKDRRDFFDH